MCSMDVSQIVQLFILCLENSIVYTWGKTENTSSPVLQLRVHVCTGSSGYGNATATSVVVECNTEHTHSCVQ